MIRSAFCFLFFVSCLWSAACTCPPSSLSLEECSKYELIFRGRVLSAVDCGGKPGEAVFEILDLFKGNSTKQFKVLFECADECARKFSPGEEWIIYTQYRQIDNAMMDWCSRSRKYFRNDKEDYYLVLYGNDYYDELEFLRKNLGNHRLLEKKQAVEGRNEKPDVMQTALILICSLLVLIGFYIFINKKLR